MQKITGNNKVSEKVFKNLKAFEGKRVLEIEEMAIAA